MLKIFETHAHFDDDVYDSDRNEVLSSMKEHGVLKLVNIGASLETSKKTIDLVNEYDFIYGTVGSHPSEVADLQEEEERGNNPVKLLEDMYNSHERIVAIGEIGLDYHYEDTDKPLQKKWFEAQLELARRLSAPVVIHSREAAADTVDMMNSLRAAEIGGVVHCFSYTKELARTFLDMGYFIGVGGVVTFKNAKKLVEAVEYIPLDRIVLETDAPYLAPEPHRGSRNSSIYIPFVAEKIAQIKGIDVDEVYEVTWKNAHELYRINQAVK